MYIIVIRSLNTKLCKFLFFFALTSVFFLSIGTSGVSLARPNFPSSSQDDGISTIQV